MTGRRPHYTFIEEPKPSIMDRIVWGTFWIMFGGSAVIGIIACHP